MKQCVQCRNDLPDTAVHCVYCGSKQPPAGSPGPSASPPLAKTVMGYPGMASDMARQAGNARGKPASNSPPAVSAFDQTQPVSNDPFRGPGGPGGPGGPPPGGFGGPPPGGFGGPPPGGFGGPPPGMGGPPPGGFGGPPPGMGGPPPGGFGGPPPGGPGPYGGPPPGYGGPPPGGPYGGPPPGGPPPGYGGPPPGYGGPPPGYGGPPQQGYGGPPPGYGHPPTEQVRPLHGHRPPYLASESGHRASNPIEPWAETLKTLMLVFGVLLVACFVAPWRVEPGHTIFSWTILGAEGPASGKVMPILFAVTGVLAVVLGALPLATQVRAFAAAGIGLAPTIYGAVAPPFVWQELIMVIGTVTLVSGLLIRSQYTGAILGRLMATIGAVCVLLVLLIPEGGGDPPLIGAFKALGTNHTVPALILIVPAVLALVSLLVWLPGPGHAGAHIIAWIWIVWPLVASILGLIQGENIGAALKSSLDGFLYVPMAMMSWAALVGYGVASAAGKQLEHA